MWTSGGRDDPGVAWRCIGPIVHDDVNPEAAPKPRLAEMESCPHGVLPRETVLDDWPEHPPEGVDFPAYESAGSLLALCRQHGLRVGVSDGMAKVIYPVATTPALVEYGNRLLDEGRNYVLNMVAVGPEVAQ